MCRAALHPATELTDVYWPFEDFYNIFANVITYVTIASVNQLY